MGRTRKQQLQKNLKKNEGALKILCKADKKVQQALLENASKQIINCLVDCGRCIIKGDVSLTPQQLNKLRQHEKTLQEFIQPSTSLKRKRAIIKQDGGFVGALLKPFASFIPTLLGGLFGGNNR